MKKFNLKALLVMTAVAASSLVFAGEGDENKAFDVLKHVIKIDADSDSDVRIFVDKDGVKQDYSFNMEELDDMDSLTSRLDVLDEKTKNKVLNALEQLKSSKGSFVHLDDMVVEHIGEKKEFVVVKSGFGDGDIQVKVDEEGEMGEKRLHVVKVLADGEGSDSTVHKHVEVLHGVDHNLTNVIKRLINKAELTPEQIEELRSALDDKY